MPIVLITNMAPEREARWRDMLAEALPEERIVGAADATDPSAFDVAIAANPKPEQLEPFTGLRFVQSLWAGVEHIVHNPALPPDAPLARLVDPTMSQAMAEGVTAHVMALHRSHPHYRRAQDARSWEPAPVVSAAERDVAFLGTGELARACMAMLAPLGFRLSGWSRSERAIEGVRTFAGDAGLTAMLREADILVNLVPLTDATRGLIDRAFLARLKPGASLINVARGAHVVDADLLAALDDGRLGEAVLDVFHEEPLADDHPFWRHPRVQVFPHVAAPTDPVSAARIAAANVRAFRQGGAIVGLVDRGRGY